jgi:hypothetical protein
MNAQEQEVLQEFQSKLAETFVEGDAVDQLQDQYCALREVYDPKEKALKMSKKEIDEVADKLLAVLDESHDKKVGGIRKTLNWLLDFTAKRKSTEITNKKKLVEILGLETYLEISSISIEDLKKYLTPKQVAEVSEELYTGKRTLKVAKVT